MKYLAAVLSLLFQPSVPITHNDLGQTGWNPSETILTPANVTTGKFGKLGSWTLDGIAFTQALYVSGSTNLVIVCTLNNTIFAFNADKPGTSPVWSVNYGTGRGGWTNNSNVSLQLYASTFGIIGTPVADTGGGFLYVVASNTTPNYILHKLKLSDGSDAVSAVTISGSVVGTGSPGDPTNGPNLLFSPSMTMQRCGLALSPDASKLYVTFAGGSAGFIPPPWHGWVFSYATSNLIQLAAFNTTPNAWGGSIWHSGGAPAVDASGNVYVLSGAEGSWDGSTNFPDTMLKLSPSLALLDWFTPANHVTLDENDYDFGAGRVMLFPGTTLAIGAGKDFNVYVVDTTCMGHLQGSSGCLLTTFPTLSGGTVTKFSGSYGGVIANDLLFLPTTAGSIYEFSCPSGFCNDTPMHTQMNTYGFPGPAAMSVSSNGSSNLILWVVTAATNSFSSTAQGTLRALNSSLTEIWNSGSTLGTMAKFVSPTVVNGKVFIPTNDNTLQVYGLIPAATMRGQSTIRGKAVIR
jgi:hypothetical protein